MRKPLPSSFYKDPAHLVAPRLVGKLLVRDDGRVGRITEVEAYEQTDEASHTFIGQTARNAAMFGPGGHLYVYFTYGMHYCANVVTGPSGYGSGVLLRACEPLEGIELMQQARGRKALKDLCSGPAKLAQAFGIDKALYGTSVQRKCALTLMDDGCKPEVVATTRIGISKARDTLWRFVMKDSAFVSKPV